MTLAIKCIHNLPPHLSCFYSTWHYRNWKFMLYSSK